MANGLVGGRELPGAESPGRFPAPDARQGSMEVSHAGHFGRPAAKVAAHWAPRATFHASAQNFRDGRLLRGGGNLETYAQDPRQPRTSDPESPSVPDSQRRYRPFRFPRAVTKKYSNGPELLDGEVWDLYTALLISTHDMFKQEGQNQATPEGVLFSIDQVISELGLSPADRDRLGIKLCNLRTSSLWDTLSELLLASRLRGALPGSSHQGRLPARPDCARRKWEGRRRRDSGSERGRRSSSTPSLRSRSTGLSPCATNSSPGSRASTRRSSALSVPQNPQATVAVVVSLIKNEIFYLGFPMKLAAGQVAGLTSPQLDALPSLVLAHACTFRCPTGRRLVLNPIATYLATPASSS